MGEVSPATRRLVRRRDGRCVAEGQLAGACAGHLDMGHLVGRGMGGSDLHDGPGWVILMCRHHNRLIEDDPRAATTARDLGLHYPRNSYVRPPRAVVRYPDGNWYTLDDEGGREPYKAPWLDKRTPEPPPRSPDCHAGKHRACNGDAWDFATDEPADCPCPCHVEGDDHAP